MAFIGKAERIVGRLSSEPLQKFRQAARGHGPIQPPDEHRTMQVRGLLVWSRRQAVDDWQVEIRIARAVLVDDGTAVVDEIQRAVDAPDAEG